MGYINGDRFQNWGGTLRFRPAHIAYPKNPEEVGALVRQAAAEGKKVRVVGSGHSWTRLVETPDILVSLDEMQGLIAADRDKCQATVWAGTKLYRLGDILRENGMALENMGDVDRQSIAGVMGTGTHGTGVQFGVISTQIIEIWLVDGTGQELHLTPADGPRFRAAQVALGALGIITRVKVQCVPAYNLKAVKVRGGLEETLARVDEHRAAHRNYEFFWFPYSDLVLNKFLNATPEQPKERKVMKYLTDVVWENGSFKLLSESVRLAPGLSKSVSKLAASGMAAGTEVLPSHKIYPTARLVRFYEMEYGVPAQEGPAVVRRIRDVVRRQKINVHFPIEYRYTRADDILISPAHGRETCFISVHMYKGMDWRPYFNALEPIFIEHGGRPHWGKMHTQQAAFFATRYPHWAEFLAQRAQLDPTGVFQTAYMNEIFGPLG